MLTARGKERAQHIKNLATDILAAVVGLGPARKSIVAVVLLLILNAGLLLAFYGLDLPYETAQTFKKTGLSFDSRSPNRRESLIKEFTQTFDSSEKEIEINFRMKAYSIGEFNNVFQTADANSGIRLELSKPATLALVFGGEKVVGAILTRELLDKWYSVSIKIDRSGKLKVFLDDAQVVDHVLDPIDYRISHLAIGAGFSVTRPFDGQIQDFSAEYRFLEERSDGFLYTFYLIFLISFAFLITLLALLAARSKGLNRRIKNLSTDIVTVLEDGKQFPFIISSMVLTGFLCATLFHYHQGQYVEKPFPWTTFLYAPGDVGHDLRTMYSEDRKSTRLNSSHIQKSRMPSSA